MSSNENQAVTKGKKDRRMRSNIIGYPFTLPNLIEYSIFVFIPVCFSFVLSVMKWDGSRIPMEFVGLQSFAQIFSDRFFRGVLWHTVVYALMTVLPTLVLAMFLAVLLNSKIRGIAFYRTAFFFPYTASIVAVGTVWNMLFQPDFGPINELLKLIGISNPPRRVVSTSWVMVVVAIVTVWKYMSYYTIVYLAVLQGISSSLYEAVSIDGANGWQKLRYITIPMLAPTTFFVLITLTIQYFKVFDMIYVMTGGDPGNATQTLVSYIYDGAFIDWQFSPAGTGTIVLFAVVLVITLIQFQGEKKWSRGMM